MTEPRESRPAIRVLVVDDSAFMRAALRRMIASDSALELVATAVSGSDALQKIPKMDPDVVTLDVQMPDLDGLETLRRIMKRFPRPVIMVSATTEENAEIAFDALRAGAVDYVPKRMSTGSLEIAHIRSELIEKIRSAASHWNTSRNCVQRNESALSRPMAQYREMALAPEIVAIGTSTGGPNALQELLPQFPKNFAVPVLIVQHMPAGFTTAFAKRLDRLCSIAVREARHGEVIEAGVAYIAPAGVHMTIERGASESHAFVSLQRHPAEALYVPSIDVLMKSVAKAYGARAAGVILTGMGCDGAEGIKAIHDCGGLTIGQDQATCVVYGMPRVCAELGILSSVVPLSQLAAKLLNATGYLRRA
jgi:two-component system chemotaxis response regulator CheB